MSLISTSLLVDEIVTYDDTLSQEFLTKSSKLRESATVSAWPRRVDEAPVNRLARRKQRTRAALITAAQAFIAAGKLNVPVLEITQAADVGMGSFYNHFDSKEQLFEAAVAEVLDTHGALLDELTASIEDPAETFACSFRLTGRLFRRRPQESQMLLANGHGAAVLGSRPGTAGAARHRRRRRGRPISRRRSRTGACRSAGGALLGLGQLLRNQPDRDDAAAADTVTEDVLRLFGLSADEAREICRRPLPDLDSFELPDSAA